MIPRIHKVQKVSICNLNQISVEGADRCGHTYIIATEGAEKPYVIDEAAERTIDLTNW